MDGRSMIAVGMLLCAAHGIAAAQGALDKAAADALFAEGKRLINKGDVAAACEKFEASLERFVQLGAQLALASCYEKLDRTASAYAQYRTAANAAAKLRDGRQRFANEHAAALEPRLSRLAIIVIADRAEGLSVQCDDKDVPLAQLGVPVPVDQGEHTVKATAPGRKPWSIKISVPATPGVVDVPVPALEAMTAPLPDHSASAPSSAGEYPLVSTGAAPSHGHLLAYGIGGAGVAAVGASLIVGAIASSRWSDAQAHCHGNACDRTGVDLASSASTFGNIATVAFGAGLAAIATGGILLFTGRHGHGETASATVVRLAPAITPSQLGLALQGEF